MNLLIKMEKRTKKPGSVLFVKLESIGDYILFRNFIPVFKEKFPGNKFTFCCNSEIKELVLAYDKDLFDDFIWIERLKFLNSISYKYWILRNLYSRGFETAINASYTREILFSDQIIEASCADIKIGCAGSPGQIKRTKLLTDRFYTKLIQQTKSRLFEFLRNKEFFELLLNTKIDIKKPFISPLSSANDFGLKNYVLLFPGSKDEKRKWSPENFAAVGNYILSSSSFNLVIEGSRKEKLLAQEIINNIIRKNRVTDLTGKTSVSGLVKIIAGAEFLITNDSAAAHIAAALNIKFICISNGSYYRRFHPYPPEVYNKAFYVYPDDFREEDFESYRFGSDLDINTIHPDKVLDPVRRILDLKQ
jgi:ADP-heptose:LPS heptosyltransferase